MASALPIPPPGFDDLSIEEKLDYLESLWDYVAVKPEQIPVPDWHLETIRERLAEYEAHPEEGSSWEEVREEILQKLRGRASGR